MRLLQSDLADFLGVRQASLSQATSEGHKCQGYPVRAWAVFDGAGRVAGYDVPEEVMGRSDGHTEDGTDSVLPSALSERENPEPTGQSTNVSLLPQGEDYFRPTSSGGTAYVVGKAIEEDNRTSHGALMVAGSGVGALIGWQTSGRSAAGAAAGALAGAVLAYLGMTLDREQPQVPLDVSRGNGQPQGKGQGRGATHPLEGRSGETAHGDRLLTIGTNGQERRE